MQRQGAQGWGTSCTCFLQSWELTEWVALPWDAGSSWGTLGTSGREGGFGDSPVAGCGCKAQQESGKGTFPSLGGGIVTGGCCTLAKGLWMCVHRRLPARQRPGKQRIPRRGKELVVYPSLQSQRVPGGGGCGPALPRGRDRLHPGTAAGSRVMPGRTEV